MTPHGSEDYFLHKNMHLAAFIKQKSYEKILYVLRHHWITFVPIAVLFLILMAIPFALYFLVSSLFPALLENQISYAMLVLFASAYFLAIYLFFFTRFIEFYLDITIVTNDRLMDVEQRSLFSRSISELDLYRIQDVTSDVHGVFATFFNYGTVSIKTASNNINVVAHDIPRPNKIREALIQLADQDRKYHIHDATLNE